MLEVARNKAGPQIVHYRVDIRLYVPARKVSNTLATSLRSKLSALVLTRGSHACGKSIVTILEPSHKTL